MFDFSYVLEMEEYRIGLAANVVRFVGFDLKQTSGRVYGGLQLP